MSRPPIFFFIGLVSFTIAFASCTKEFRTSDTESKFVVLAEITADDTAFIPMGKSSLTRTGEAISFEKVTNASVSLEDETNLLTTLRFNTSADFVANPTAIYSSDRVFSFNKTYTLWATHPQLGSITATTHIPGPFQVSGVVTEDKEQNDREVLVFNFSLHDPATEKNYYIFEAVKQLLKVEHYFFWQGTRYNYDAPGGEELYDSLDNQDDIELYRDTLTTPHYLRLNLYAYDKKTDNDEFGSLDSSFHRVFITDSTFNGGLYHSFFAVAKEYFEADEPQQAGRVLIRIKSVSKELYEYLADYERYRYHFGIIPTQQLASPKGNIENGLGIFGGVSKKEWAYYYDELE